MLDYRQEVMPMSEKYLTPQELSDRWNGSPSINTLNNWVSLGKGPMRHIKAPGAGPDDMRIGSAYYVESQVKEYEQQMRDFEKHESTINQ